MALFDSTQGARNVTQVTFASPGSGGPVFAYYYGKRIQARNYVSRGDAVPKTVALTELERIGNDIEFLPEDKGHSMASGYLQYVFSEN